MQGTGAHKVLEPADQAISVSESDGSVGVGIWVMMGGKVVAPKQIHVCCRESGRGQGVLANQVRVRLASLM